MNFSSALVTGGAGFIGSHLTSKLKERNIRTIVLDDLSMGKEENLPSGVDFIKGDVLDYPLVKELVSKVDVVFHLAARVSIRNSISKFYDDGAINILGTLNVLRAIAEKRDKKTKIVYASSMAAYGHSVSLPIKEDSTLEPISPYGISKLAGERYCLQIANDCGFKAVALRYFNTYGTRQTLTPYVGVITIFINLLLKNRSPVIFGDGIQKRDFVYVEDVAEATVLAMEKDVFNQSINVGTGIGTSVNKVARILKDKINPDITLEYGGKQVGEPTNSVADTSKAGELLGFIPSLSLEKNIDEVINWNREDF